MQQNIAKLETAVIQMTVIRSRKPATRTKGRNEGREMQRKEEIKTEINKLAKIRLICFENNFLQKTMASADYITGTESKVWQEWCQSHAGGNKQE